VRGVFRRALLETAAFLGQPIQQRHVRKTQLPRIEAAFITNAVHGIMPVSHLMQRPLNTEPVNDLYQTLVGQLPDPLNESRFNP
jgi:branched-subunit amino acid aminotransferase/4-amino-4-deoxychorismate lyase